MSEVESIATRGSVDGINGVLMLAVGATIATTIMAVVTRGWMAAMGISGIIFLGAFATGAMLGFLFGVPRVLTGARPPEEPAVSGAAVDTPTGKKAPLLQSNTNLEKISDWLTTLLVGAGLAQFHELNGALLAFRTLLEEHAAVFGTESAPTAGVVPVVGCVMVIFGAVCGFLYMYLNTRLVLTRMFDQAEGELARSPILSPAARNAVTQITQSSNPGSDQSFIRTLGRKKAGLTVQDAVSMMLDLLYKPDPQAVIDIGATLSNTQAEKDPRYWFYLAAAFGQKQQAATIPQDAVSARDNALDCARRAVALDSGFRQQLWDISDPTGADADLAGLRENPDFLRLVGRP